MEPLKNKKKADQTLNTSAVEQDNNDDNEFATTGLKATSQAETAAEIPSGGRADKVDTASLATATPLEQKLTARMDELVALVEKAGEKIQRLGEAICRIGDQVEHLPERRFGVKREKDAAQKEVPPPSTPLN